MREQIKNMKKYESHECRCHNYSMTPCRSCRNWKCKEWFSEENKPKEKKCICKPMWATPDSACPVHGFKGSESERFK